MFLSPELDINRCQNYTKTNICKIWYKIRSNKTNHIQQMRNQSENNDIPGESEKLKFAPIII